jgi:ribosomal protein S18 acetylase RimI-like enzyme
MMIRNATEADFMPCVNIVRAAWPEFKERESIYHLFCKHFNHTCFIAEEAAGIRGFLLGFLSQTHPTQAYIHLVAIDPGSQRRGLASSLYRTFFETVSRMGRREVSLIVNPDNGPSLDFHRKLGFRAEEDGPTVQVGGVVALKDYNGPGKHMVLFHKTLTG